MRTRSAVIMHHGSQAHGRKVRTTSIYYITLLERELPHARFARLGTEEQIIKGMYLLQAPGAKRASCGVNLLGSGSILRESIAAQQLLEAEWGVATNVWSCPSFNELARDGQDAERWNLLHPTEPQRKCLSWRSNWPRPMSAPWSPRPTT
jgi:pyruvate dehydrogenase E1 component